jgi:hypothetical protein
MFGGHVRVGFQAVCVEEGFEGRAGLVAPLRAEGHAGLAGFGPLSPGPLNPWRKASSYRNSARRSGDGYRRTLGQVWDFAI